MPQSRPETYYGTCPPDWSAGVLHVGREACDPGHAWEGVRDYYLLHFVRRGRGEVRTGRRRLRLGRGDAFLYAPGEYAHYAADDADPWEYLWVGFRGRHVEDLIAGLRGTRGDPTMRMPFSGTVDETLFELLATLRNRVPRAQLHATGLLYRLLAYLGDAQNRARERTTARDLVDEARVFIHQNFQREIDVADVIRHIGMDRSHFSRMFRSETGSTLREFLITTRMERAHRLIRETDLTMRAVAASVGYRNYASFERRYRASFGLAPSRARTAEKSR